MDSCDIFHEILEQKNGSPLSQGKPPLGGLGVRYHPILHMHGSIRHAGQLLVMGNNYEGLLQLVAQIEE